MTKKLFLTVGMLALVAGGVTAFCYRPITPDVDSAERVHLIPESKTVDTSIILYENGRGLVSQTRRDTLAKGLQDVTFGQVSKSLILPSVLMSGDSIRAQTQNFDPVYEDKSYYERAQEQAVGKEVVLLWSVWKEGALTEIKKTAKLLAVENREPVLLIDGVIQRGTDARILYPQPDTDTPQKSATLDFTVYSETDQPQDITLSFLTRGFSWHTDYIVSMDETESAMNLKGYVTLKNNSGFNYKDTSIDFVLGDFNITSPEVQLFQEPAQCEINQKSGMKTSMDATTVNGQILKPTVITEEGHRYRRVDRDGHRIGHVADMNGNVLASVGRQITNIVRDLKDYYVYKLPFKTTLKTGKPVQALFLEYQNLPYEKEYVFDIRRPGYAVNLPPDLYLIFNNQKDAGVGMPLPKGTFRVFNQNNGKAFFVGEAHVGHTLALGQKARLNIGEALDVYANIDTTANKEISDTQKEISYSMTISNVSDEEKSVVVSRDMNRPERDILSSDAPYTGYTTVKWTFSIPAGGTKTFAWTEQVNDLDLIRRKKELELEEKKKKIEEDKLAAEKELRNLKYKDGPQVRLVLDN